MPEDLKLSQIGSSQLPPPFRGLHSPGVRKLSNYLCLLFLEIVYSQSFFSAAGSADTSQEEEDMEDDQGDEEAEIENGEQEENGIGADNSDEAVINLSEDVCIYSDYINK